MGWGNESLFNWSRSHDKDAHICPDMVKTLKNLLLWNQTVDDVETWYAESGARVLPSLFK